MDLIDSAKSWGLAGHDDNTTNIHGGTWHCSYGRGFLKPHVFHKPFHHMLHSAVNIHGKSRKQNSYVTFLTSKFQSNAASYVIAVKKGRNWFPATYWLSKKIGNVCYSIHLPGHNPSFMAFRGPGFILLPFFVLVFL